MTERRVADNPLDDLIAAIARRVATAKNKSQECIALATWLQSAADFVGELDNQVLQRTIDHGSRQLKECFFTAGGYELLMLRARRLMLSGRVYLMDKRPKYVAEMTDGKDAVADCRAAMIAAHEKHLDDEFCAALFLAECGPSRIDAPAWPARHEMILRIVARHPTLLPDACEALARHCSRAVVEDLCGLLLATRQTNMRETQAVLYQLTRFIPYTSQDATTKLLPNDAGVIASAVMQVIEHVLAQEMTSLRHYATVNEGCKTLRALLTYALPGNEPRHPSFGATLARTLHEHAAVMTIAKYQRIVRGESGSPSKSKGKKSGGGEEQEEEALPIEMLLFPYLDGDFGELSEDQLKLLVKYKPPSTMATITLAILQGIREGRALNDGAWRKLYEPQHGGNQWHADIMREAVALQAICWKLHSSEAKNIIERNAKALLEEAMACGDVELTSALLTVGVTVEGDLLEAACRSGHLSIVQSVLGSGVKASNTSLGEAAGALDGNGPLLALLMERGAKVNAITHKGNLQQRYSAITNAVRKGFALNTLFLLDHGADLYGNGTNALDPLVVAVEVGDARCLRILLAHGSQSHIFLNVFATIKRWTEGHYECLRLVLEFGAQSSGQTITPIFLTTASVPQQRQVLRLLLDYYEKAVKFPTTVVERLGLTSYEPKGMFSRATVIAPAPYRAWTSPAKMPGAGISVIATPWSTSLHAVTPFVFRQATRAIMQLHGAGNPSPGNGWPLLPWELMEIILTHLYHDEVVRLNQRAQESVQEMLRGDRPGASPPRTDGAVNFATVPAPGNRLRGRGRR